MRDISFFSSNQYIFLPNKRNPKVALAVDSRALANNAFKLYNPFSKKAKMFKNVLKFSTLNLNFVVQKLMAKREEKSNFISYLEKELNTLLVASLYYATIKDKIVIQLQTRDAKVVGYVKYPLNEVGLSHTKNEIKAFELLSAINIIDPYILSKEYQGKPFLLLSELDGEIGMVEKKEVDKILKKFVKNDSFPLLTHPRIRSLKSGLLNEDMKKYSLKIDKLISKSTLSYSVVYEHGDFTPWNIVKVGEEYRPFDFEYFVEEGLEYFDLIKYYYQIAKLLEQKNEKEIIEFIYQTIQLAEIETLFQLFLIKEIVRNNNEDVDYAFELSVLNTIEG